MLKTKKFTSEQDKADIRQKVDYFTEIVTNTRPSIQGFYHLLIENWQGTDPPSYTNVAGKLDPRNKAGVRRLELHAWAVCLKPVFDKFGLDWKASVFDPDRTVKMNGGRSGKFILSDAIKHLSTAELVTLFQKEVANLQSFFLEYSITSDRFDPESLSNDVADEWAMRQYAVLGLSQALLSHCPGNLAAAQAHKNERFGRTMIADQPPRPVYICPDIEEPF